MSASNSFKLHAPKHLVRTTWVVVVGILGLTSCQYFPKTTDSIDAEDATKYQGRIAFKSSEQSFVTLFRWLESDSDFQLVLRDRLALGGVRIEGNDSTATVEYSDGKTEENVNLDAWIEDNLGISISFRELWNCLSLNCELIDDAETLEYDQYRRLETFTSDQWTFTFSYQDADPDSSILNRLELHKEDIEIKIIFTKFEH